MRQTTIIWLVLAAGSVTALAGCSGAGAPATEAAGASLRSFATDNLDALSLFAEWTKMLYPKAAGSLNLNGPEMQSDGSQRFWGTTSDGGDYEWFWMLDGSGRGSISWPGGLRFTQMADPVVWSTDHKHSEEHFINTYPDGGRLECRIVADYGSVTVSTWRGAVDIPGHQMLTFELRRLWPGSDELMVWLEDGRVLQLTVPLKRQQGEGFPPAYARGASGSLGIVGERVITFSACGTSSWDKWTVNSGSYSGEFTLGENWASAGQLRDGDVPAGALRWTSDFSGILDQLNVGQAQVVPSAAALDALIRRWCENVNSLQPMPMY